MAAEVAPFSKTGGLADVSGALTKYLDGAGHDVRLFTPLHATINRSRFAIERLPGFRDVPLEFGPHRYRYDVWVAKIPGSEARAYFIDCAALYGRPTIYTSDADEHLRFLALTRAAFECCQRMGFAPHVIHCNDWHTAFAPLLLKAAYDWDRLFAGARSVLTIHNIGYQGIVGAAALPDLGLAGRHHLLHQDDLAAGRINSLKHGILYADAITTVSPTYAREICTDTFGMGLQDVLRARGAALVGILNGVDYDEWDPRNDRYLPHPFDERSLTVKAKLKTEFLARIGLPPKVRTPLIGLVSRLTVQKGLDLLFDALPEVLARRGPALVALGSGEARYEQFFAALQRQFPRQVVFHRGYNEELAHWIEATSDLFVMPSLYEPCGLNQMYSLRYGTVPIVRRTGGLADSVQLWDPATGEGTGIVFNDFNPDAMRWALNAALDLFADRKTWKRLVQNGMAQDFSWQRQGALYVDLYRSLLGGA
jgi:starch synthase